MNVERGRCFPQESTICAGVFKNKGFSLPSGYVCRAKCISEKGFKVPHIFEIFVVVGIARPEDTRVYIVWVH